MNKKLKKIVVFLVVITTILSVSLNAFAWGSTKHGNMVEEQSSTYFTKGGTNYREDTVNAAKYTDTKDFMDASSIRKVGTAYIISPYHAKANLSCSTVQATSYTSAANQGYSFSDVETIASFLYSLAKTGINGNTINLSTSSYTTNVKKRIVLDLQNLIDNQFSGTTSNYKKGYIILGVYLHLIQDISAHRAVVTASRIKAMYSENSAVFSNYSGAIAAANTYSGIPMIRLKDYLTSNVYEDDPDYWPARYSVARVCTSDEVTEIYNNNSFSFPNFASGAFK